MWSKLCGMMAPGVTSQNKALWFAGKFQPANRSFFEILNIFSNCVYSFKFVFCCQPWGYILHNDATLLSQNRYWPEVSLRRYFVRNFTSADVKIRHHDAILECTRKFFIGKHRYKVPCALQDGVIARKKNSDVFLQPKHIGVSLLVWYLFCAIVMLHALHVIQIIEVLLYIEALHVKALHFKANCMDFF
jgi:hypothetical protein